jgi:hypothetical protein
MRYFLVPLVVVAFYPEELLLLKAIAFLQKKEEVLKKTGEPAA